MIAPPRAATLVLTFLAALTGLGGALYVYDMTMHGIVAGVGFRF